MTFTPTINALAVRAKLGRKDWGVPHPFGPDGWMIDRLTGAGRIIVTAWDQDGEEWLHASISGDQLPTYDDMVLMHQAVFPGFAYEVFAPPESHVNIALNALHLWGRADGSPAMPDFGRFGTI